jgi:Glyoxalase-like domain
MNPYPQIDHLLTKVQSAVSSGQWFEARGFTVTPLSSINTMGIENRLVLFNSGVAGTANFIELMGVQSGAQVQKSMQQLLSGPNGSRSIVLVSHDAYDCADHLRRMRFSPGEVHNVKRQWLLPNETLDLEFDVLLPIQADLTFNVCKYFTLEHYLRPSWTSHANGVSHLSAIFGVVEDAEKTALAYARILGGQLEKAEAGHYTISNFAVCLHVFEANAYEGFTGKKTRKGIVGYELTSADLDLTVNYLHKERTPLVSIQKVGQLMEAFGNDVIIRQAMNHQ